VICTRQSRSIPQLPVSAGQWISIRGNKNIPDILELSQNVRDDLLVVPPGIYYAVFTKDGNASLCIQKASIPRFGKYSPPIA
jgi:hypothetical protein